MVILLFDGYEFFLRGIILFDKYKILWYKYNRLGDRSMINIFITILVGLILIIGSIRWTRASGYNNPGDNSSRVNLPQGQDPRWLGQPMYADFIPLPELIQPEPEERKVEEHPENHSKDQRKKPSISEMYPRFFSNSKEQQEENRSSDQTASETKSQELYQKVFDLKLPYNERFPLIKINVGDNVYIIPTFIASQKYPTLLLRPYESAGGSKVIQLGEGWKLNIDEARKYNILREDNTFIEKNLKNYPDLFVPLE